MVVVRMRPDTGGSDRDDAPYLHEDLSRLGFREDRVVLVVVIDHEETDHQ